MLWVLNDHEAICCKHNVLIHDVIFKTSEDSHDSQEIEYIYFEKKRIGHNAMW